MVILPGDWFESTNRPIVLTLILVSVTGSFYRRGSVFVDLSDVKQRDTS